MTAVLFENSERTRLAVGDVVDYLAEGKIHGPFVYTGFPLWAGSVREGRLTSWVFLPLCLPDAGPDVHAEGGLFLRFDGATNRRVPR